MRFSLFGLIRHCSLPLWKKKLTRLLSGWRRLPVKSLVLFFRGYQLFISPLFPPTCRYIPTCSQYAIQAVRKHGALRGSLMAIWRILRCHPFAKGGFDPVK